MGGCDAELSAGYSVTHVLLQEGRPSFSRKRSKKLFILLSRPSYRHAALNKSLLLLFFRKEDLA
jgi:hypothetical protein